MIGGSDDICKSVYNSIPLFSNVIHLDPQIDIKPKFKFQIQDKDK